MKGTIRSITWLAVFAMATLVMACQENVPPTEPNPPPKPTLLGTWERVFDDVDDDGDVITRTQRLVFSESGKAFWHVEQFDVSGQDRHDPYGHIADWSATVDTITKTFIHDEDDDQWDSDTLEKSYYLSGSGDVLFVHHWDSDDQEDSFERYTRVQDPVPSNPSLLGTWEYERGNYQYDELLDEDVLVGKSKLTLTFTENRYILVETPRVGDQVIDHWHSSGTWTDATESRLTKMFRKRSFDKEYAWGAGGELFVTEWNDDPDAGETQSPRIERYTRVESPLPPLTGVWVHSADWERDDGTVYNFRTRLTIGEEFEWLREEGVGGASDVSYTVSGSWRHDEKRQFVIVDVRDAVISHKDFSPEDVNDWIREHKGHQLRLAYASAGVSDQIMISSWHREQDYDPNTNTYADSEEFPYGRYHSRFVKQP